MRILIAVDGSRHARGATAWLRAGPLPPDTAVLVLAVAAPPSALASGMSGSLQASMVENAGRVGRDALAMLAPRWPGAELRVSEGDPREEIVRVAEEWDADLIVLGARGIGGVQRLLLGSVSLDVARHAPCSVLVVAGRPRTLRTVVLAMDGSDDSARALEFLQRLRLDRSVRVRLVGVTERLRYPASAPAVLRPALRSSLLAAEQERRRDLETFLGRAGASLEPTAGTVETTVVTGQPAEEIAKAANAAGADLVVVGARGLGGIKRLLLGSVSERLLHSARCPVLIVRRPRQEAS